jgi:hypothetical protein
LVSLIHIYFSFPLLCNIIYHPLSTMILLWSAIFATLVGLASAVLSPRDSGFNTLTQDQVDATDLYAHYASAVKCDPKTLKNWNCGSAYLTCVPSFSCRRKGWGAMHDEPVLTHCFPCQVHCQATPNFELNSTGGNGDGVPYCAHVHQAVNYFFCCHLHADAVNRVRGL